MSIVVHTWSWGRMAVAVAALFWGLSVTSDAMAEGWHRHHPFGGGPGGRHFRPPPEFASPEFTPRRFARDDDRPEGFRGPRGPRGPRVRVIYAPSLPPPPPPQMPQTAFIYVPAPAPIPPPILFSASPPSGLTRAVPPLPTYVQASQQTVSDRPSSPPASRAARSEVSGLPPDLSAALLP